MSERDRSRQITQDAPRRRHGRSPGLTQKTRDKVTEAKRLMREEGLTQDAAARRVGMAPTNLSNILNHGTQNPGRIPLEQQKTSKGAHLTPDQEKAISHFLATHNNQFFPKVFSQENHYGHRWTRSLYGAYRAKHPEAPSASNSYWKHTSHRKGVTPAVAARVAEADKIYEQEHETTGISRTRVAQRAGIDPSYYFFLRRPRREDNSSK